MASSLVCWVMFAAFRRTSYCVEQQRVCLVPFVLAWWVLSIMGVVSRKLSPSFKFLGGGDAADTELPNRLNVRAYTEAKDRTRRGTRDSDAANSSQQARPLSRWRVCMRQGKHDSR